MHLQCNQIDSKTYTGYKLVLAKCSTFSQSCFQLRLWGVIINNPFFVACDNIPQERHGLWHNIKKSGQKDNRANFVPSENMSHTCRVQKRSQVSSNVRTQFRFSNFQNPLLAKSAISTPRCHSEDLHRSRKFALRVLIKISLTKSAKALFDSVNAMSTI